MFSERKERDLEARIDAWRVRVKDDNERKTLDEVFDQRTLMTLMGLISSGAFETLDYPVSTGKEGNVFMATAKDGPRAVKIYRTATATFTSLSRYIVGDPRFKDVKRTHREIVFAWALKEYKNLQRMREAGVPVPRPYVCERNILVMEYIGDETQPAPLLKEVKLDDAKPFVDTVIDAMRRIHKAGLVHGDLSEYNILVWNGGPVIIDCAQAVLREHPNAEEWFRRDTKQMARYFTKLGVKMTAADLERRVTEA